MRARDVYKATPILLAILLILLTVMSSSAREEEGFLPTAGLGAFTPTQKIAPDLYSALGTLVENETMTVIVRLYAQADLSDIQDRSRTIRLRRTVERLRSQADNTQQQLRTLLANRYTQGEVNWVAYYWIFNGLAVNATADVVYELAARPEVASITADKIAALAAPAAYDGPVVPNLNVVSAPALWDLGFRGQNIVVANMDTGVDLNHPDLITRWRGGSNSWFDPNGQHPTIPTDLNGHGTWTMGVMVGDDNGSAAIGVAPDAQWIAVKIFDDQGVATATVIHLGFQWLLDPDNDPLTDDAPHVVNNSWTFQSPGCDLEFQGDLTALRTAGILPIFAAGNAGPGSSSSYSPGNNPGALAVGATNNNDGIYFKSSRGPATCGGPTTTYPELVAPGVNIRSTDLFGLYATDTGTSMAAPHIAGGLALILSAFPDLSVPDQEAILLNGAVDLGSVGPDDTYGYGRLDLLASYQWWLGQSGSPTPTPTVSNTPGPTDTPPPPTATHTSSATPTNTPPQPTATNTPLPATATSTTTPTATNTPVLSSATPTALSNTIHVGDLEDNSAFASNPSRWNAVVTVTVHDGRENPVAGVTVNSTFTFEPRTINRTCLTNSIGQCDLIVNNILSAQASSGVMTVTNVSGTLPYASSDNHDPDGGSSGTAITVAP